MSRTSQFRLDMVFFLKKSSVAAPGKLLFGGRVAAQSQINLLRGSHECDVGRLVLIQAVVEGFGDEASRGIPHNRLRGDFAGESDLFDGSQVAGVLRVKALFLQQLDR